MGMSYKLFDRNYFTPLRNTTEKYLEQLQGDAARTISRDCSKNLFRLQEVLIKLDSLLVSQDVLSRSTYGEKIEVKPLMNEVKAFITKSRNVLNTIKGYKFAADSGYCWTDGTGEKVLKPVETYYT